MGVTRWLDRIEPERWSDACRLCTENPPETASEAEDFLSHFGVTMDQELGADFDSSADDEEMRAIARSQLFEKAVTVESWYLDKALRSLESVLRLLPGTRVVVKQIVDFGGLDMDLPDCCSVEGGFYGACSSDSIKASAEALSRFQELKSIRVLMDQQPAGVFSAFSRTHSKAAEAYTILEDEYILSAWKDLGTAVITCADGGHHLGLGMLT